MPVKDFDTTEETNRGKKADDQKAADSDMLTKEEASPSTGIKNAHASGSGSIGRNESSLPEEEEEAPTAKPAQESY